ncbi:MAG: FAD-binding oxidoreductase [Pseudomonadota bacterium]
MNDGDLIAALAKAAGESAVRTDDTALALAASDVYESGPTPCAVVQPDSAERVAAAVLAATSRGYAVVPRGGGLSYTAGYLAANPRSVTLDLAALDRVYDVSPDDMTITVGAGTTWKKIEETLRPLGLRLPFFGTFSGKSATVGGGLSHGALFFGSARYGSAADIVLGLQVACADGSLLSTGQRALAIDSKPFLRSFGPDLTGLFVHDGGALGVKTAATFKVISTPPEEDYASFAFKRFENAAAALSDIARRDLAEEVYVLDPGTTDNFNPSANDVLRSATALAKSARGPVQALSQLVTAGTAGTRVIPEGHYSLHLTAAGRSEAAVNADRDTARELAEKQGGVEVASTIPRVSRADRFSHLNDILGPDGGRWTALNAKVAHSDAPSLVSRFEELLERHDDDLTGEGVRVTRLATALSNHCFSFEPVFHWTDSWLPIHREAVDPSHLRRFNEPAANASARALVATLRKETIELFRHLGAASNQIGRAYPYYSALAPGPAALLTALKQHLDPQGLMNPGVLELAPTATAGSNSAGG